MKFLIYCFLSMLLVLHLAAQQVDYGCYNCDSPLNNPCGKNKPGRYFLFCPNPFVFIQCGESEKQCYYKRCRDGTVWDQAKRTCKFDPAVPPPAQQSTYPWPPCPVGKYDCKSNNPCIAENRLRGNYHFGHKTSGMFVQCDDFGGCSDKNCNDGLVWEPTGCACTYSKK